MKNIIIILLFSFLCIFSYAQERFYSLYDGWCIDKVFCYDEEYLSLGMMLHSSTSASFIHINRITATGGTISSLTLDDDTEGYSIHRANSFMLMEDTVVAVGASALFYKGYYLNRIFMKYNVSDNEFFDISDLSFSGTGLALNYLVDTLDNGFVIAASDGYSAYNHFPMLLFTDAKGDTLSVKSYFFTPNVTRRKVRPYQLLKLPDGGFLMSCQDEVGTLGSYHADVQRCCFLRLDNEGNELWRSYTTNTDTITFQPFAALMPDGDYLIAWSDPYLADAPNSNKTLWLARMTDAGFIYGKKKILDEIAEITPNRFYIYDSYQDDNGNVYFTGRRGGLPYPAFLLKVNSSGISEWYREYVCFPDDDAQSTYTKIYGITPTEDGGFIMGGEYFCSPSTMFPSGTQQGLVIKVDSMGCLEEGCGTTNIRHTINAINAEIYPNPASKKITITLAKQTNTAHIKIYDAKGCLWVNEEYENSEMDVSQLPVGIYTVNIWAEGKFYVGKFVKK